MTHPGNRTKRELLDLLRGASEPGSMAYEQARSAVLVACTEDIEAKLDALTTATADAAKSNSRLASVGVVLNFVLVAATVVMAWATWVAATKP